MRLESSSKRSQIDLGTVPAPSGLRRAGPVIEATEVKRELTISQALHKKSKSYDGS
jgi:hypothetical protein